MIYFKQLKLADCLYPTLDIYYFGFLYLNSIAFLSTIKQSLNSQVTDFKFFSFKAHVQKTSIKEKRRKMFHRSNCDQKSQDKVRTVKST